MLLLPPIPGSLGCDEYLQGWLLKSFSLVKKECSYFEKSKHVFGGGPQRPVDRHDVIGQRSVSFWHLAMTVFALVLLTLSRDPQ